MSALAAAARLRGRIAHAAGWRLREARSWAGRTAEIARATRAEHPGRDAALARRAVDLLARRGFTLDEAYTLGLFDPSLGQAELDDRVPKRRMVREQAALNPNELWYLTEDKAIFYRYAEAVGVRVPVLHAILCESGPAWTRTGAVLTGPSDWARHLETAVPDEFVVKPARGYYGLGVRLVSRRDGALHVVGAGPTSADALCRELAEDRQFHIHLVQERLRDHPEMPGGGRALQTLRVITLMDRLNEPRVINSQWRLAVGGGVIDNFHGGTTGNVLSIVQDLRDGTLGPVIRAGERRRFELVPAGSIPGTPAPGARVPLWDEVVDLVHTAARRFLPMRCIGWDVAVTPDGPVIVEANIWWDPPSPQRGTGELVRLMRESLGD
ncbi:sugar-transfer associated ATP-grasp domain-containing protein [Miltoncostaea marina]|uniref:sugar-transfer associated ATP-grasp domain-containing protein n=1 Tax=Miltoncostaea marina TaxID=2843215 RepID=UPI001C3DDB96|nr:sugar-transfer associated ATP-grasp domain-containing protein [Miltoncostaea marina]